MPHRQARIIRIIAVSLMFLGARANANAQPARPLDAPPSRDALLGMLQQVPELDLYGDYAAKSKAHLALEADDIVRQNAGADDAFIKKLIESRADLAGLPFIMGKECRKPADQAKLLAEASLQTRTALGEALHIGRTLPYGKSPEIVAASTFSGMDPVSLAFFLKLGRLHADGVASVHQVACVEKSDFRMVMIKRVQDVKGPQATQSLIKMALYDVDADVRAEALYALADRPRTEYRAEVLAALQHPWTPVVRHAVAVAVALKMKEIVPDLEAMLKQPDPSAPFTVKTDGGREKTIVRELVRINHHRNCMLCHAPVAHAVVEKLVGDESTPPIGPVTSMADELPPGSSALYYSPSPGIVLVRADITYLRQDFSVQLKVRKPGNWPALQRYDFFVRTREATAAEMQGTSRQSSVHAQSLSDALKRLN